MFTDQHEIEKYMVAVTAGSHRNAPDWYTQEMRWILKGLPHGLEPEVYVFFAPDINFYGFIVKNQIFDAQFALIINHDYFEDVYATLRTEKPVYFHYTSSSNWTDPSDPITMPDILGFSLYTGDEPVGEGLDATSLQSLRRTKLRKFLLERKKE